MKGRLPLSSTLIHSVEYSTKGQTLEIYFHSGAIYQYYNISEDTYYEFINADSPGKYYNEHIKGQYNRMKIPREVKQNKK